MSRFKDILKADAKNIFLNEEEFASVRIVDGKPMTVVTDDNEVIERAKTQTERTDGIFRRQFIIYVSAEEMGKLPAAGRAMKIDGQTYTVVEAVREGDIYSITLGANRS